MKYSAKARLPLQLYRYHLPFVVTQKNSQLVLSSLTFLLQWGRKYRGLSSFSFLEINAKGGESIKPKAKGPHHQFKIIKKRNVYFNWYLIWLQNFNKYRDFNWYNFIWHLFQKDKSLQKPS
jgi:hypothetical protein